MQVTAVTTAYFWSMYNLLWSLKYLATTYRKGSNYSGPVVIIPTFLLNSTNCELTSLSEQASKRGKCWNFLQLSVEAHHHRQRGVFPNHHRPGRKIFWPRNFFASESTLNFRLLWQCPRPLPLLTRRRTRHLLNSTNGPPSLRSACWAALRYGGEE